MYPNTLGGQTLGGAEIPATLAYVGAHSPTEAVELQQQVQLDQVTEAGLMGRDYEDIAWLEQNDFPQRGSQRLIYKHNLANRLAQAPELYDEAVLPLNFDATQLVMTIIRKVRSTETKLGSNHEAIVDDMLRQFYGETIIRVPYRQRLLLEALRRG